MRLAWTLILGSILLAAAGASSRAAEPSLAAGAMAKNLPGRMAGIAGHVTPSPAVAIAAGWFLMGSIRVDDDPYGLQTQYDDTELPQHKVWLDAYEIDRDEVSLGEYLAFLRRDRRSVSDELQRLIWHMITVHAATDDAGIPCVDGVLMNVKGINSIHHGGISSESFTECKAADEGTEASD